MVSVMAQLERGRPEVLQAKSSSFGQWLKAARQKKGWSGEMLATAVETSQSMISAYERGFRSPRREKAAELATALGADPREALEALMADTPGLTPAADSPHNRAEDIALLNKLTEDQYQRLVRPLLEELAGRNERTQ